MITELFLPVLLVLVCVQVNYSLQYDSVDSQYHYPAGPEESGNTIRYDSPDDCKYRVLPGNDVDLVCNLRTVNSELDHTNFTVIQSEPHVEPHCFMHKTNLTRVDLYANQLTSLDVKALRLQPIPEEKQIPEFYIGGNPFICDCNIDWLQKINHVTSRQYPTINDIETVYCKLMYDRERSYVALIEAEPKHFLCSYSTHCFALCHCCEFDACDCEMTCPNNCHCYHDNSWSTNIVEYLDADMRLYLRTNTCIEWDDKKFWQKLRIALPHVKKSSCLNKRPAINIYATANEYNTTGRQRLSQGCPPGTAGTLTPVNMGLPVQINRLEQHSYATIGKCPQNCDNYNMISNCKYNTTQHLQSPNQPEQRINELGRKATDRQHEYAVPSNCLVDSSHEPYN
ncbi:hypothetical protein AND_000432 [Anopheles darlingi]|uniref:Uncharacterized protein n=1 Tax=Anopheles darlingi TaxID=43151 RepID=W5JWT5_ANODA|nr:hypothetical protein AND_000432 [Anopheles darlingi]